MVKVGMAPIPIAVPVRVMPRHDVVANASKALIRLPCDYRPRSLCARTTRRRLYMRWVPKCREARSCALKVRSATSGMHSSKPYAASTAASSGYDMSATTEPTAAETATAKVAAAESTPTMEPASASSTATAVASGLGLTQCSK